MWHRDDPAYDPDERARERNRDDHDRALDNFRDDREHRERRREE